MVSQQPTSHKSGKGLRYIRSLPQRTCITCREVRPKKQLVRIVRTISGKIEIDERGKKAGRGVYLCRERDCWERGLIPDRMNRALRTYTSKDQLQELKQHLEDHIRIEAS